MEERRVVITGIGAVSPLGTSLTETWNRAMEGCNVAGPVRRFDASGFPCKIAYEVDDSALGDLPFLDYELDLVNRAARYGVKAALEAIAQSGLPTEQPKSNYGVSLGVGMGAPDYDWYGQVYIPRQYDKVRRKQFANQPQAVTNILARLMNATGEVCSLHTACASSGQSIGDAYEAIRYGSMDVMLTGGCDSMISPYYFAGFCLLGALTSTQDAATACRPFDANRSGFVLGEGASMMILEDLAHAQARGASILGEIVGYGCSESAYRITDLHPEGRGPVESMQTALQSAGIAAGKVGYVNAHGTSTKVNDHVEALSVAKVLHKGGHRPFVGSTKSMTGHMISAAGAMELTMVVQALRYQVVPPHINYVEPDPDMAKVRIAPGVAVEASFDYGLSNSVGFGGSNTTLVAKRWRD